MKLIRYTIFVFCGLAALAGCTKTSSYNLNGHTLEGSIVDSTGAFIHDAGRNFSVTFSKNSFVIDGIPANKGTFTYVQIGKTNGRLTLSHDRPELPPEILVVELSFHGQNSGTYFATLQSDDKSTQSGNFRIK